MSVIEERLKDKMVAEFWHIRKQAVEPLATFLDFITYSYMIDNVIFLLTGTRHRRDIKEPVTTVFLPPSLDVPLSNGARALWQIAPPSLWGRRCDLPPSPSVARGVKHERKLTL